jgi:glycosyltransferase involved in cell wall biosynthesis
VSLCLCGLYVVWWLGLTAVGQPEQNVAMASDRDSLARVAVAIPAYEAAGTVGDVVERCRAIIPDVLVVDDGSHDGTADAARAAGADVHRLPVNSGKGSAVGAAFGILFSRGFSTVITVDADGQHVPEEMPLLMAAAVDADLVLGTRDHLFSEMSVARRTANRLSSRAISLAAGGRFFDVQTGFRLYTRHLVERTGYSEPRFEAESAVLVRAVRLGFRVKTTPVRLANADGRATSHYRPLVDSLRIAAAVVRATSVRHLRVSIPM